MKFSICILFALFALQGTVSANENDYVALALVNQKIARGLLDDLMGYINKAIDSIKNAIGTITEYLQEFLNSLTSSITNEIAAVMKTIQDLIDKAVQLGIDAAQCLPAAKEALENLANSLIQKGIACIENIIQLAVDSINAILAQIMEIKETALKLSDDLTNCGWDVSCIGSTTATIIAYVAKKVPQVISLIADIGIKVQQVPTDAQACVAKAVADVAVESVQIVDAVKDCIANLVSVKP